MKIHDNDVRFQVTDQPRTLPINVGDLPPVSLVWRFLNAEHQRAVSTRHQQQKAHQRLCKTLVDIAESVYELRKVARMPSASEAMGQPVSHSVNAVASRIEETLAAFGVGIFIPEGEPFSGDLMEIVDNVAQRSEESTSTPFVAEVLAPAVMFDGELLQPARAVIGIPAGVAKPSPQSAISAANDQETQHGENDA